MTNVTLEVGMSKAETTVFAKRSTYNIAAIGIISANYKLFEDGYYQNVSVSLEELAEFIDFCSQRYTTISIRILPSELPE